LIRTAVVVLASLVPALAVAGGPPPDAKRTAGQLLAEGNTLFEKQQFDAALARYQAAYETYPSPKILLNLGAAHAALNEPLAAVEFLERFLKTSGVEEGSALENQARDLLAASNAKLGRVGVVSKIEAEVVFDKKPLGRTPIEPFRAIAGEHHLEARADGYPPFVQEVRLEAGATLDIELAFKAESSPTPPISAATPVAAVATENQANDDSIFGEWWFWGVVGVVVAGAAAGAVVAAGASKQPFSPSGALGTSSLSDWTHATH
jgi:hypothetical protein